MDLKELVCQLTPTVHLSKRPDDIKLAIEHGGNGVMISNHGGCQRDGAPTTLDVLRECAPIAKGKILLLIDGGIRRGSDIFKPWLWGQAIASLVDLLSGGWLSVTRIELKPTSVHQS